MLNNQRITGWHICYKPCADTFASRKRAKLAGNIQKWPVVAGGRPNLPSWW